MKHINPRSFTGLIGITVLLLSHASQAQEGSLAEQVAAAKAHSRQQGDSDVLGHTSGGDYRNEFFGFQLKHIPGWTSMSRGMMNVDEALGRDALGLHAGINPSASRVFGMHDEAGGSVIIVIVRLPEGEATDSASVKAGLIRVVKTQLPSPVVSDETVLLDDASHHFSAVRVSYTVRDNPIFQSMQVLQLNGYAVSVTVSASSENDLKQLLLQLQTSLQWNLKQQSD